MKIIYENSRIKILFDERANIFVVDRGNLKTQFDVFNSDHLLLILPLLAEQKSEIRNNVYSFFRNINQTPILDKIIVFALDSGSNLWVDYGLLWLDIVLVSEEIGQSLKKIIKDKKYSQKTRHKAMSLIR